MDIQSVPLAIILLIGCIATMVAYCCLLYKGYKRVKKEILIARQSGLRSANWFVLAWLPFLCLATWWD